jgi:type IX secretion system PorP/SprF family membrane protein
MKNKISFMLLPKIFFATMVLLASQLFAQDFSFSQFYEKPLLRNPALAGVFDGDIRVSGIFRNQWQSVTIPYQTSGASVETKFPIGNADDYLTLGLQMTNDVAGDIKLKRTQLLPVINFHKSLNQDYDSYLSMAFMAGNVSSQFDASKLQLNDQFVNGSFNANNPTMQIFDRTSVNYWDLSAGLSYSMSFGESASFYVGASMFHVNQPKVGFYSNNETTTLSNKFTINTGLTTPTGENNRLVFFADYYSQANNKQAIGGILYGIDLDQYYDSNDKLSVYFGGFYRWKDAFIPIVKLDLYKFSLGMSYDVNTSQLKTASQSQGGFELAVSYHSKLNVRYAGAEKMRCVKFVF